MYVIHFHPIPTAGQLGDEAAAAHDAV